MNNGPFQCVKLMIYYPFKPYFLVQVALTLTTSLYSSESLHCSEVLYCSCWMTAEACIPSLGIFLPFVSVEGEHASPEG